MPLDEVFTGEIIFEFLGASMKFLVYGIWAKVLGKSAPTFSKIWKEKEPVNSPDFFLKGIGNVWLGVFVSFIVMLIITRFN